jgi:hypothetical protein
VSFDSGGQIPRNQRADSALAGIVLGGSMGSYEEYRDKALECLAAAETVSDPHERLVLLEIAQRWLRLAAHVGTRNPGSTPPGEDPIPEKS